MTTMFYGSSEDWLVLLISLEKLWARMALPRFVHMNDEMDDDDERGVMVMMVGATELRQQLEVVEMVSRTGRDFQVRHMAAADGTPYCADRMGSGSGCWASAAERSAVAGGRLWCTHHPNGRSGRRIQGFPLRGALRGGNASSSHRSHRHDRRNGADAGRARSRLPVIQMEILE